MISGNIGWLRIDARRCGAGLSLAAGAKLVLSAGVLF